MGQSINNMHYWDQILDLVQMAYTPTLSIIEPEKAVTFDHMGLKSKLILTLGSKLWVSFCYLCYIVNCPIRSCRHYFENLLQELSWIKSVLESNLNLNLNWLLKSESLESILWSQNTSNNLGLQGAETRVVCEPQDCLKNSISGGNGRDKLCAMCKRSSYLNMQDIFGKSRWKYHLNIYRFNLRDWFIKK